jgi:hypothetical protein
LMFFGPYSALPAAVLVEPDQLTTQVTFWPCG